MWSRKPQTCYQTLQTGPLNVNLGRPGMCHHSELGAKTKKIRLQKKSAVKWVKWRSKCLRTMWQQMHFRSVSSHCRKMGNRPPLPFYCSFFFFLIVDLIFATCPRVIDQPWVRVSVAWPLNAKTDFCHLHMIDAPTFRWSHTSQMLVIWSICSCAHTQKWSCVTVAGKTAAAAAATRWLRWKQL